MTPEVRDAPIRPDLPAAETPPAADADTTAPPRRRRAPRAIAILIAVALAVWGGATYLHARAHVSTDNAQVDGHIIPIAPKVQAFVREVLVDDNQPVDAGDTLIVLDDRALRLQLRKAEAELAGARAQAGSASRAGTALAQLEASRATAAGAQAAVAAAEAAYHKAEADLERYRGLAEKHIIAAQQFDAVQAAFDAARAKLTSARRQAAAASSQVTAADAALRSADARLAAAQAAAEYARLQLGYTVITAPTAGVVARRAVEPGELVQVGQSLMAIVPLDSVWVTANLKETQLAEVSIGDQVEFTVDAYPDRTFEGRVRSVSPATGATFALLPPDNATGNFTKVVQRIPVRIAVDGAAEPAYPLRPGMSVEVSIRTR